jgi:hypothetical protein
VIIDGGNITYEEPLNSHATQPESEKQNIMFTFYKALFDKKVTKPEAQNALLRHCKRLENTQKTKCDAPLTIEELTAAVRKLARGSTPGLDGLTSEFLVVFWKPFLGKNLLEALNSANGKLKTTGSHHFSSLNEGVQAVLYKDKGKREELKNYRPITMLNACYKVLATAMTIRTGAVI